MLATKRNSPTLTNFTPPNYAPDLADSVMQGRLSVGSYTILHDLNAFDDKKKYEHIYTNANREVKRLQKIITKNTDFSTPVIFLGGIAVPAIEQNRPGIPIEIPNTPRETYGLRAIGIADYKKVVAHVCCYDPGEVSHIENIMAKELKSKATTRESTTETTVTTSIEQEKEKLTDTVTSERFQMQSEISKMLSEQRDFSANTSFNARWGTGKNNGYTLDLNASYSTSTSKEESNRQAVTQSKDITQRAMERIVTKIKNETVVKTIEKYTEENIHEFDNRLGENHVSGVYRYINAIYKNQIYNYGKRMMYEFMIPEPAKLHRLGMMQSSTPANTIQASIPKDPRTIGLPDSSYLNEYNYQHWAAGYNATVKPIPLQRISVGKSFAYNSNTVPTGNAQAGEIQIPDGYVSATADCSVAGMAGYAGWFINVMVTMGPWTIQTGPLSGQWNSPTNNIQPFKNAIPITFSSTSYNVVTVTINIGCVLTQEAKAEWQEQTFAAIIKGYEDQMAAYNDAYGSARNDAMLNTNPGFYREIEQGILRKLCLGYLSAESRMGIQLYANNPTFTTFNIPQTAQLEDTAAFSKFMEQAFEWELISYNFYPYYWAAKTDWVDMYQYDCNDPLFRNFMQAGMARVIVTVKPGFEDQVMYYMSTGRVWAGGLMPVLNDPLYLSIVDELAEQEYVVEESWETVVPTNLIALQSSGVAVSAEGLPCGDGCKDHAGTGLINNDHLIMGKI